MRAPLGSPPSAARSRTASNPRPSVAADERGWIADVCGSNTAGLIDRQSAGFSTQSAVTRGPTRQTLIHGPS